MVTVDGRNVINNFNKCYNLLIAMDYIHLCLAYIHYMTYAIIGLDVQLNPVERT